MEHPIVVVVYFVGKLLNLLVYHLIFVFPTPEDDEISSLKALVFSIGVSFLRRRVWLNVFLNLHGPMERR